MPRLVAPLLAVLTATTAVVGTGLATPSPAAAAVVLDCSAGPVAITDSTEDYVLTGVCGTVTIAASNVTVSLSGATRLDISGANVDVVSSGPVDVISLSDAVSSVRAPQARLAKIVSSNVTLRVDRLDSLKVTGANNTVTATKGTKAKVKGANNQLTYTKLRKLVIKGANNHAKVRKGRTSVTVRGPNNVVHVHRPA
jgi:hypothetical protein